MKHYDEYLSELIRQSLQKCAYGPCSHYRADHVLRCANCLEARIFQDSRGQLGCVECGARDIQATCSIGSYHSSTYEPCDCAGFTAGRRDEGVLS